MGGLNALERLAMGLTGAALVLPFPLLALALSVKLIIWILT